MDFPESWRQSALTHKMLAKSYNKRVVIVGAMMAAEADRVNSITHRSRHSSN